MPIRRAAASSTPEKAPSAAAEEEPEASSEESPSNEDEQAAPSATPDQVTDGEAAGDKEPTENGEEAEGATAEKGGEETDKKELKDGYKYKKGKSKKVKRTIPAWASVAASKKLPVTNYAGTQNKVNDILVEAITSCNDKSGVSYQSFMKYILKKYPEMDIHKKKFLIKKAMKKHLEKGTIKQLKGKGLSGTFTIGKQTASSKKAPLKTEALGDALPLIITRLCEPKEASYLLIKKYLEQHFPDLNVKNRPDLLKTALVKAVEKGILEQITGKGASGTFQLKRNQVLPKGNNFEDAITAAVTAMNEPKTCSTTTLRKYLVDANKDRKEYQLVASLRRTLTKCKVLGWMEQITGHGFTGTYRLSFPFYPSPTILYPDKFNKPTEKSPAPKRRRAADSSDEEESEEEEEKEEEESEDEAPVRKRKTPKRPPPKARRPPPAKKSRSPSLSKAKGRGRTLAKKSPAKKAVSSAKRRGKKPAPPKKETPTPVKATPVKRGAPATKPKTPAVKKLPKRGAKRVPASRDSSPEEAVVTKETTRSRRSKPEESSPKEPVVKKPANKRQPEPEPEPTKGPAAKKGAKGGKPTTRKSKRGKN
ncbi:heterochromatin protein 1-binding protein 3 isoform X2 [Trematomus bernacchii]|uniref:heterochromatin protein 1-binding protein 3 isoform X2 n=1 Tax=Trematomus bernacchii TaxID=40690 RepID=UPI00146DF934|nr:heterochromatin protein 1-binding protein 3 isoform X2 [Trematomus bernacchii]